jgi:5-methylthioadenosine/S-adenosylhomocysteine deaminase
MEKSVRKILALIAVLAFLPVAIFSQTKSQKEQVDTIIVRGIVVTMDSKRTVLNDGAVAVRGGRILAVAPTSEVLARYRSRNIVNAGGRVVIPGLVNTHTHVPMTLFRGLADDLDLQEWLTQHIFPAEARNVDENFVRAGTRLALVELIRGGTTTFNDMYYFEDAIAEETSKAGMRAVLGQTLIDFPAPDFKTFDSALEGARAFVTKWKNHPLITPAIAPHAPYTVSTENLLKSRRLADELKAPVHIHVAEAASETEFIQQNHKGLRPIEYLESIGFFGPKTIAAHVIQANEGELLILKNREVGIAHNPQSNMKLAAGVAPVPSMLRLGLRAGLGTDGAASNNDLNLWEEMDTAAKLHKVFLGDPKVATAEEMFAMATIGGARALHLEDRIGSIEAGKRADIVMVDFDRPNQTPFYNIYSHLVYATKADSVDSVMIEGRWVMIGKRLLTLDESAIKKVANAYHKQVIESFKTR